MNVSFNAVLIGVKDILKSKVFYENVFGIAFDEVRPPFSCFSMKGIEFMIEENTPERSENWAKNYIGTPKGICFETDDIEGFLKVVEENGGTTATPIKETAWNSREAKFLDPDGNIFIIEQNL